MSSVDQAASAELLTPTQPRFGAGGVVWLIVVIALLSVLATFLSLIGLTPYTPSNTVLAVLMAINAIAVLLLSAFVARQLWVIIQARRRGRAGARLHVRIIGLFAVIAAVPAVLVAFIALVTLNRGLDQLFSTRTKSVIESSMSVAQAYVREHAEGVTNTIIAMAHDVVLSKPIFDRDRGEFRRIFTAQAGVRGLSAAFILAGDRSVIERAELKADREFVMPTSEELARVPDGRIEFLVSLDDNYAAAVLKLPSYENAYLYVARVLDPRVVAQLRATRDSIAEFAALEEGRPFIQRGFALIYAVIVLVVLLSAVLIGLNFTTRLVAPIRRLIGAADLVSTGNLYVQVPIDRSEGDLGQLGETFNKMTQELRTQRDDLVRARDVMDSRRRFTEAVLAGASAGVIGVDPDGHINILNRSAERLIGQSEQGVVGRPLAEVVPELADMLVAAQLGTQRLVQGQATISRRGRERNLSVRVTSERSGEDEHGYVITLDDITELVSAQRTSAWADVARRIAHEIKNPLTPIQLSAERLRRKYGSIITEDRGVFEQCTDTIVRQVDDIKRMVDEFSRFARMPKPVMAAEDVADTVRQTVFLMRVGHPDIDIESDVPEDPIPARFDRRLISQALTNIIKNATEAVAAVPAAELDRGRIHVSAFREGEDVIIDVVDNGVGLPKENRSRLLEPYMTTREKGTGLGLAIVGRILEEHGGSIELSDASLKVPDQRGAWVRLRFKAEIAPAEAPVETEKNTLTAVGER